jgi:hypothetical protein
MKVIYSPMGAARPATSGRAHRVVCGDMIGLASKSVWILGSKEAMVKETGTPGTQEAQMTDRVGFYIIAYQQNMLVSS